MSRHVVLFMLGVWAGLTAVAEGRTWTDSTGHYRVEADLMGFNEKLVVLKREDRQLISVPIAKLSQEDQAFLRSKDLAERSRRSADALQTWTMASGLKVIGKIVDYAQQDITIQRRDAGIHVNHRPFESLPEVYQRMLPRIVAHFEKTPIDDKRALDTWVVKLHGQPRTFTCEGVLLRLENGDEYGIPFFLFSADDLKVLQPGWERWFSGSKDRAQRAQESFLLQAQAQAYQQDRMANQQIAMMQLEMQGYEAGLFDLWEVRLLPGRGVASPPLSVVVPARDSRSAALEATRRNPGFMAGPVSRVRRKYE